MIDGTKASADSVTTSEWPCARRSVASHSTHRVPPRRDTDVVICATDLVISSRGST